MPVNKWQSHEIQYKILFSEYSYSIYSIVESIVYSILPLYKMLSNFYQGENTENNNLLFFQ